MNGPYKIKNLENQRQNIGTIESPHFFHITTGKRCKKSLLFHAQIEQSCHTYQIKSVGSETLILRCVKRDCPARALAKVPKENGLITIKVYKF